MSGMRRKTINTVIRKKMDEWLASIEDVSLRGRCRESVVVTGGCLTSMLLGEEIRDFDIYLGDVQLVEDVSNYYLAKFQQNRVATNKGVPVQMFVERLRDSTNRERVRIVVKSAGIARDDTDPNYQYYERDGADTPGAGEYVGDVMGDSQLAEGAVAEEVRPTKPDYFPVFLSSNAISLKGGVQIIIRFYGDQEEIHKNFDYVHCTNYWTYADGVQLNPLALEATLSKTLIYNGSLYPVCSVFRAKKFIERGWNINAGQYLKMCLQISDLDLHDPKILEEQLTGVDVAYFQEMLVKASLGENSPDRFDTAYLVEIINRMF